MQRQQRRASKVSRKNLAVVRRRGCSSSGKGRWRARARAHGSLLCRDVWGRVVCPSKLMAGTSVPPAPAVVLCRPRRPRRPRPLP